MALPFFFEAGINETTQDVLLDEFTSKHMITVLRMQMGENIHLTNGTGLLFTATIIDDNRKRCVVRIVNSEKKVAPVRKITIAISPLKNNSRMEWFLEKATEIGVHRIVPIICTRTEKTSFKKERMQTILQSAMLQSQQCYLPLLDEPIDIEKLIKKELSALKLIAHCDDQSKTPIQSIEKQSDTIILIGPEGDFTADEIQTALQHQFLPVTLGETRLRTETAGIVAAALLCI